MCYMVSLKRGNKLISREARLTLLKGNLDTLIKAIGLAQATNPISIIFPIESLSEDQTRELGHTFRSYYQIASELYGESLTSNILCKKQYRTRISLVNDIIAFKQFIESTPLPEWASKLDELVPEKYTEDFTEAYNVIDQSLKSAGMLARRLLERILIEEYGFTDKNLYHKLTQAKNKIPSQIYNRLIAVRQGGNVSVHPMYKADTSELIEMEKDEIIFLLESIAALLNYHFVDEKKQEEVMKKITDKATH